MSKLTNENIEAMYQDLLSTNSDFKKFVEDNKNLSSNEIISKYDLNICEGIKELFL